MKHFPVNTSAKALRVVSRPLDAGDIDYLNLGPVMGAMVAHVNGKTCVGLAAIQLGVPVRIIRINCGGWQATVINPEVVKTMGGFRRQHEGCLSFPGQQVIVSRPYRIKWAGFTPDGELSLYSSKGMLARTVLHEIDHLNGVSMFMRANDIRLSYKSQWEEDNGQTENENAVSGSR